MYMAFTIARLHQFTVVYKTRTPISKGNAENNEAITIWPERGIRRNNCGSHIPR